MTTTLLGANGKLGSMLAALADEANLGWRTQARSGSADIGWSGSFDDPLIDQVFERGGTLINMIGHVGDDVKTLKSSNINFVENLLHAAADKGVAHVVLASSAAVYGAGDHVPLSEDAPFDPKTPYGASKVAMERVAKTFAANRKSPQITVLRIGNVAGADALTTAATRSAAKGTAMQSHEFSDGASPTRSYIGPRDMFTVIRDLSVFCDEPLRVINVCHPQIVNVSQILKSYRTHVLTRLRWITTPAPEGIPRLVTLSTAKMENYVHLPQYKDPADAFARQVADVRAL